jgi:hypothetical protein
VTLCTGKADPQAVIYPPLQPMAGKADVAALPVKASYVGKRPVAPRSGQYDAVLGLNAPDWLTDAAEGAEAAGMEESFSDNDFSPRVQRFLDRGRRMLTHSDSDWV